MSLTDFENLMQGLHEPEVKFDYKNPNNWTSMQTLIAISAIDEEYDVILEHEDLKKVTSLNQLFVLIKSKMN